MSLAVIGSAPVPAELVRYFRALGFPVAEAYGMSECTTVATINPLDDVPVGSVGFPLEGLEIRLLGDGEILIRSPWLMSGYLRRPELTAETIDADGWLHSGDIGVYEPDGRLKSVDRKKELIISAFGKNTSPSNIEARLKEGPIIGQAAVVGDARPYNVALLVMDIEVARAAAGDPGAAIDTLARHPDVVSAVERAVSAANERLARVEQIKRYALLAEEWLPGGDELSPTMKLRRKPIQAKYGEVIERLYAG